MLFSTKTVVLPTVEMDRHFVRVHGRLGGLIDKGIIQSSTNWNDIKKMGVYRSSGDLGDNAPAENSYGVLRVYNSGGAIVQEFTPYVTTGTIYIRLLYGSWTPWSVIRGVNI